MVVAGRDGKIVTIKTLGTTVTMITWTNMGKKVKMRMKTIKAWRQKTRKTVYPSKFTKTGRCTSAQCSQMWQILQSPTSSTSTRCFPWCQIGCLRWESILCLRRLIRSFPRRITDTRRDSKLRPLRCHLITQTYRSKPMELTADFFYLRTLRDFWPGRISYYKTWTRRRGNFLTNESLTRSEKYWNALLSRWLTRLRLRNNSGSHIKHGEPPWKPRQPTS